MISEIEKTVAFRYLKPKRKEGFLKIISIFSFLGIALGVAVLIIVMSVMNGFRTELIDKILGFNAHIIIKPYEKKIENKNLNELNSLSNIIEKMMFSFSGEGILINRDETKGILVRGYLKNDLKKPEQVNVAKKKIQNLFSDYYVYSWADLNKSFFGALKVERNVMFIILSLIIVVAAFNIISGLTISVKNKTKEIAILRTLGVSKKSIAKIFFLVGFSIGLFATLTGVLLGVLFSYNIEKIRSLLSDLFNISLFPEEIYFLSKMPSEIDLNSILIITLCSLAITILASIFPSYSASKLDPVKALKYE